LFLSLNQAISSLFFFATSRLQKAVIKFENKAEKNGSPPISRRAAWV